MFSLPYSESLESFAGFSKKRRRYSEKLYPVTSLNRKHTKAISERSQSASARPQSRPILHEGAATTEVLYAVSELPWTIRGGTRAKWRNRSAVGGPDRRYRPPLSHCVSSRYTFKMIRAELGRRLRELNIAALSSEDKLKLNERERSALLAMLPDRGWSDFVRRWRRRKTR
jgi:hypothetical protein